MKESSKVSLNNKDAQDKKKWRSRECQSWCKNSNPALVKREMPTSINDNDETFSELHLRYHKPESPSPKHLHLWCYDHISTDYLNTELIVLMTSMQPYFFLMD